MQQHNDSPAAGGRHRVLWVVRPDLREQRQHRQRRSTVGRLVVSGGPAVQRWRADTASIRWHSLPQLIMPEPLATRSTVLIAMQAVCNGCVQWLRAMAVCNGGVSTSMLGQRQWVLVPRGKSCAVCFTPDTRREREAVWSLRVVVESPLKCTHAVS